MWKFRRHRLKWHLQVEGSRETFFSSLPASSSRALRKLSLGLTNILRHFIDFSIFFSYSSTASRGFLSRTLNKYDISTQQLKLEKAAGAIREQCRASELKVSIKKEKKNYFLLFLNGSIISLLFTFSNGQFFFAGLRGKVNWFLQMMFGSVLWNLFFKWDNGFGKCELYLNFF